MISRHESGKPRLGLIRKGMAAGRQAIESAVCYLERSRIERLALSHRGSVSHSYAETTHNVVSWLPIRPAMLKRHKTPYKLVTGTGIVTEPNA